MFYEKNHYIINIIAYNYRNFKSNYCVKVGNNIRVTVPGSTSVNISGNRKARVKAGKGRVETESGNGTLSESGENISISGTLQTKTIKLNGGSVHISGVNNSVSKR